MQTSTATLHIFFLSEAYSDDLEDFHVNKYVSHRLSPDEVTDSDRSYQRREVSDAFFHHPAVVGPLEMVGGANVTKPLLNSLVGEAERCVFPVSASGALNK